MGFPASGTHYPCSYGSLNMSKNRHFWSAGNFLKVIFGRTPSATTKTRISPPLHNIFWRNPRHFEGLGMLFRSPKTDFWKKIFSGKKFRKTCFRHLRGRTPPKIHASYADEHNSRYGSKFNIPATLGPQVAYKLKVPRKKSKKFSE